MLDPLLATAGSLLLGYVFLEAGWSKLRAPLRYQGIVKAYRIVPVGVQRGGVYLLAGLELLAGLLFLLTLASPLARELAVRLGIGLLVLYMGAIAVNLQRGRIDIACGCGGSFRDQHLSGWLLVRNTVLAGMALLLLVEPTPRALVWLDYVNVGFAAGVSILLYNICGVLLSNSNLLADK